MRKNSRNSWPTLKVLALLLGVSYRLYIRPVHQKTTHSTALVAQAGIATNLVIQPGYRSAKSMGTMAPIALCFVLDQPDRDARCSTRAESPRY
jgi:hypothetical protein